MMTYERVGYRCIQGYPSRICCGCTSGCWEPVFVETEAEAVTETGRVLTDEDFDTLAYVGTT